MSRPLTPQHDVHTVNFAKYGDGRVMPNYHQTFSACRAPLHATAHLEPGRNVALNLRRLPTPNQRRDCSSTILMGGHGSYEEMIAARASEQRAQRERQERLSASRNRDKPVPNGIMLSDETVLEWKRLEQQRHEMEFDIAVRREKLMEKQRQEQEYRARSTQQPGGLPTQRDDCAGGAAWSIEELDAPPPPPPPRAMTPAQRTRKTLRVFEERAKTPDLSFEALYKTPTSFTVHRESSRKRDEYDDDESPRSPQRSNQQATCASSNQPVFNRGKPPRATTPTEGTSRLDVASSLSQRASQPRDRLNSPEGLVEEVAHFESRLAAAEEELNSYEPELRELVSAAQSIPAPKLILMLFRFGNVRNLPVTEKLRTVGYAVLHEQFSSFTERGCITRQHFLNVVKRYVKAGDLQDSLKILNCFDRSTTGDVDMNHFLLGFQILMRCASAGDTLKYCFSLLDPQSRVPRYVTRFEVQSLLASALEVRREKAEEARRRRALSSNSGLPSNSDDVWDDDEHDEGDKEFHVIARALKELMEESWRYDYMGRIDLMQFMQVMRTKVASWKRTLLDSRGAQNQGVPVRPSILLDSMGLTATSAAAMNSAIGPPQMIAAAHRMSSKKMLLASLQYQPTNALKDPHRIPAPTKSSTTGEQPNPQPVPLAQQTSSNKLQRSQGSKRLLASIR